MSASGRRWPRDTFVVALALVAFSLAALSPWHPDPRVRRATGIVLATLILWITEIVPLGITGLLIPVAATFAGVLKWSDALVAWSDPILFLFLGAFLLARALEKHGVFDFLLRTRWTGRAGGRDAAGMAVLVMLVSGVVSTVQSNTAVAAILLPLVLTLARRASAPALLLLGLSYGATFGGMATPIGTPPNFLGYAAMKQLDPGVNFLSWLRVGVPVWLGTTVIAWGVLSLTRRWGSAFVASASAHLPASDGAGRTPDDRAWPVETALDAASRALTDATTRAARRWTVAAFGLTVALWLTSGAIVSLSGPHDRARIFVEHYLPESLVPIFTSCLLFIVHVGPRRMPILSRSDFQALDWDTLYLIAGGLCLGKTLQTSGAAAALASAIGDVHLPPLLVMFGLGAATVLLSELTSNTATAALMVPIAASLAPVVGLSPVDTVWLVAMCASLGFALPVSTPPNAIVYGTRLVPLRLMATLGVVVDLLALTWVVICMRWLT